MLTAMTDDEWELVPRIFRDRATETLSDSPPRRGALFRPHGNLVCDLSYPHRRVSAPSIRHPHSVRPRVREISRPTPSPETPSAPRH